ncbi:hypothetical protein A3F58_00320 [Candidatus Roizmanbacteria bacterium RIFCSPHIGHO2_12_FULL_37_9b]|nr:MAG: hypothetical protein A3F58_00320 [Candidatus Roizmanbacteria bacterium RIFCSPHIGHO2_12_FULL_37_9b]
MLPKEEAAKNLNQELRRHYDDLTNLRRSKQIQSGHIASGGKFWWQEVIYGPDISSLGDDAYRGYLMIEPEDFPRALALLEKIGADRKNTGKRLDFKWLLMTYPDGLDTTQWANFVNDPNNIGRYDRLEDTNPRIVIYGDSSAEVQEILALLAEHPEWSEIERHRLDKYGGKPENAARRPGTNAFNYNDKQYRSLNWNDQPGYSEDEAEDEDWRAKKVGDRTVVLTR